MLQLYCQWGDGFIWRAQKKTTHVQLLETIVILVSGKRSRGEKIEVALGDNNGWWGQQTVQIIDKFTGEPGEFGMHAVLKRAYISLSHQKAESMCKIGLIHRRWKVLPTDTNLTQCKTLHIHRKDTMALVRK